MRLQWSREDVDQKLQKMMSDLFVAISKTADKYQMHGDFQFGANALAFQKLADGLSLSGYLLP